MNEITRKVPTRQTLEKIEQVCNDKLYEAFLEDEKHRQYFKSSPWYLKPFRYNPDSHLMGNLMTNLDFYLKNIAPFQNLLELVMTLKDIPEHELATFTMTLQQCQLWDDCLKG